MVPVSAPAQAVGIPSRCSPIAWKNPRCLLPRVVISLTDIKKEPRVPQFCGGLPSGYFLVLWDSDSRSAPLLAHQNPREIPQETAKMRWLAPTLTAAAALVGTGMTPPESKTSDRPAL
jgi:hypothetical protein